MITLTPEHELWGEFIERLEGQEGCNFRELNGKTVWTCAGNHDLATKILKSMGDINIETTLKYCYEHGGHCDCEILFNVDPNDEW